MSSNSSTGSAWNKLRLEVLIRDNYQCVYCGREATEADHVYPKALGGKDSIDNLVAACKECNGGKGAKTSVRLNYFDSNWLTSL